MKQTHFEDDDDGRKPLSDREAAMTGAIGLWLGREDLPETDEYVESIRSGMARTTRLGLNS